MKNIKVQRMTPLLLILSTTLTFLFTACSQPETGYQGYIDVDYTNLSTQSSGTITAIHTEKGTEVQKGDRLIQLDDTNERLVIQELEAQLEGAKNLLADMQEGARLQEREIIEAQLAEASAALKNATDEYARYQALYEKQTVSPSVYEAKELIYKTAQARVDAVNHQLELARQGSRSYRIKAQEAAITQLETKIKEAEYQRSLKTIISPEDATVFDLYYREGELLTTGKVALRLVTPEAVKLRFFVPQKIAQNLKVGQKVSVELHEKIQATVTYISPTSEYTPPIIYSNASNARLLFMVEAKPSLEQAKNLVIGQPVKVELHAGE